MAAQGGGRGSSGVGVGVGKGEEAGSRFGGEERWTRRGRKGKGKGAGEEGAVRGDGGGISLRTAAQILSARVGKGRKGKK